MSTRTEDQKSLVFTLAGEVRYPKTDETGKLSFAITVESDKDAKRVYDACHALGYNLSGITQDDDGVNLLNVHSKFDFPVFDLKTKEQLNGAGENFKINHGAKGFFKVCMKEYTYRGRKGVTNYVMGVVLEKNGVAKSSTDWASIMSDYE